MLKKAQPDVEFVTEQAPPLGKVDAGAVVQAIDDAKPDAIFNVLFGADLAKFVREGNDPRHVQEPHRRQPARRASRNISIRSRTRRRSAGSSPAIPGTRSTRRSTRPSSPPIRSAGTTIRGSARSSATDTMKSLAAGIAKAGSTDTEKLIAAFRGLKVDSPFGPFAYRASDHQATRRRLCRQDRAQGRQGHHDRLQVCRRRQRAAVRRRGEEAAPGGRDELIAARDAAGTSLGRPAAEGSELRQRSCGRWTAASLERPRSAGTDSSAERRRHARGTRR